MSIRVSSTRAPVELLAKVAGGIGADAFPVGWESVAKFVDDVINYDGNVAEGDPTSVFRGTHYQTLYEFFKATKTMPSEPAVQTVHMLRFQAIFTLIKGLGGQHVNLNEGCQRTSKSYLPPLIQRMADELCLAFDLTNATRSASQAKVIIDTFAQSQLSAEQYVAELFKFAIEIHDFTVAHDGHGYVDKRCAFEAALKWKSVVAMPQVLECDSSWKGAAPRPMM